MSELLKHGKVCGGVVFKSLADQIPSAYDSVKHWSEIKKI